jgi:hypothetical protein
MLEPYLTKRGIFPPTVATSSLPLNGIADERVRIHDG